MMISMAKISVYVQDDFLEKLDYYCKKRGGKRAPTIKIALEEYMLKNPLR